METFRFFHISDLHFSKKYESWRNAFSCVDMDVKSRSLSFLFSGAKTIYPSTYIKDAAISAYEYIRLRSDQADAVVVTGDLATTGANDDLSTALNYFKGVEGVVWNPKSRSVGSLIDSELHIIMMPGNHDRYCSGPNWLAPGNKSYENHFEPNWSLSSQQNELRVHLVGALGLIKRIEFNKNNESALLYCIDFSLRKKGDCEDNKIKGFFGQGFAYQDILEELKKDIAAPEHKGKLIIWAIHFSPNSEDELLKLYNADEMMQVASELNVSMILCGHVHDQKSYQININGKNIRVFCAGTVCSVETDGDGNSFWDIEFDVKDGEIITLREQELKFDQDLGFLNN